MEAYKLSKDCKNQKIAFSTLAYLERKDEDWKKIVSYFLDLDFAFLCEDLKVEEGPAPKAKEVADLPTPTPTLST